MKLDDLRKLGLKRVGKWTIKNDKISSSPINQSRNSNEENYKAIPIIRKIPDEKAQEEIKNGSLALEHIKNIKEKKSDVLYAFVINDKIKYIGKTKSSISRLSGYSYHKEGQQTNRRCNKKIGENLEHGVDIWACAIPKKIYEGFDLSIVAGLEDGLIKILKEQDKEQNKNKEPNYRQYCWNWTCKEIEKDQKQNS